LKGFVTKQHYSFQVNKNTPWIEKQRPQKHSECFARKRGLLVVTILLLAFLACAFFLHRLSCRETKRVANEDYHFQQHPWPKMTHFVSE
jgi:hypothetical protein